MPDTETLTETELSEIDARLRLITDDDAVFVLSRVPALCRSLRAAWAERDLVEKVFKFILPNRPLATISELAKPVLDEVDALRTQNQTQRESITYFQENEKKLKAQLVEARQQRDDWERARRDDEHTFERIAKSVGMSWCCMAETMELESRIQRLARTHADLQVKLAQVEQERSEYREKLLKAETEVEI